jgi:hypothetical protein
MNITLKHISSWRIIAIHFNNLKSGVRGDNEQFDSCRLQMSLLGQMQLWGASFKRFNYRNDFLTTKYTKI